MARTNYITGNPVSAAEMNTLGTEVNRATTAAATTLHSLLEQSPAPSVTTQAASQTKAIGETATFTSAATTLPGPYPARPAVGRVLFQGINHPGELLLPGDIAFSYPAPVPTLKWQSRVPPSAFTDIVGAVTAVYTTPLLTSADNGREYRPLWNNLFGSTPGTAAVLTITGGSGGGTPPPAGTNLLNAEQRFNEGTGAIAWSVTGATIARSTTFAYEGTKSIQITATGGQMDLSQVDFVPVTAGNVLTATVWLKHTAPQYGSLRVGFYNGTGVLVGTPAAKDMVESTAAWYQANVSGTVPTGATQAKIVALLFGGTVGNTIYWDDASLTVA